MWKYVIAAAAVVGLATGAAAQSTMRVSYISPPGHHAHTLMLSFQSEVEKTSSGAVKVVLYPAEQAFKAAENTPAVARGAVEAALSLNSEWGKSIPEMNVTTIPYFFSDLDRIIKFPGSEAARILDRKIAAHGVTNIAWIYISRQAILTSNKQPIVKPDDLKGLRVRGYNAITDAGLAAAGALPWVISGPEVYQALATGVVEIGMTDVSTAFARRYYDVHKFGTVAPYFSLFFTLEVNPTWWGKLAAEERGAIEKAARKVEREAVGVTEGTSSAAVERLREKGMTIRAQTPEEQKAWAAVTQKAVIEAFIKAAPQDGARLIEMLSRM